MQINPFNGDRLIGQEIKTLIQRFNIKTIVETGTWSGHTTRAFRDMLPAPGRVITIDNTTDHLIEDFGPNAVHDLQAYGVTDMRAGIEFILGDSGVEVPRLLPRIQHPALFYLDAHGGGSNPLKEEILALGAFKKSRNNCVLAIHDFQVPGKIWGYNGYGMDPLSMTLIEPWLRQVYPRGFKFHYNEQAEGCQRGIAYIYPA